MSELVTQIERHLQYIDVLIPQGENTKEYLARTLDEQITFVSAETSMGFVPPFTLSAASVYASARMAVELVEDPERLAAKPEGIVDIGTIEWLLRPALLLSETGLFQPVVSGPWQKLPTDVAQVSAKSVCRIDLTVDGYESVHIGTGFVVGKDGNERSIVMTNAHVVEQAVRLGWTLQPELRLVCNFARYTTGPAERLLPLVDEYNLHPHYDLALVYLSTEHTGNIEIPPALKVSKDRPDPIEGASVGVLGHPSFDSNLDPFPKYFGFGDMFGVKRFSPGYIRKLETRLWREHGVSVFLHDATTLSGSSGSCILELGSMKVVGLHFGGWPMPRKLVRPHDEDLLAQLFYENGAVPLWTLEKDPLLRNVDFV